MWVQTLERELRANTPASKAEIEEINDRLLRIENMLSALTHSAQKTNQPVTHHYRRAA